MDNINSNIPSTLNISKEIENINEFFQDDDEAFKDILC